MRPQKLISPLLLILLLVESCFLFPKPEPQPYVPVPQIFKDYTVFQEGHLEK